jgi:hypothetical protein
MTEAMMNRMYVFAWVVLLATITLFGIGMVTLHTANNLVPVTVSYFLTFGLTSLGYVWFAVEIRKYRKRNTQSVLRSVMRTRGLSKAAQLTRQ